MQYSKYSWFNVWMFIHIFKAFLVKWLWPWRESRATDQPACRTQKEPGMTCMPQRPSPMFHVMWCHFMPLHVASALPAYTSAPSLPREAMGIQFWDLGWFFPCALYLYPSSRAERPLLICDQSDVLFYYQTPAFSFPITGGGRAWSSGVWLWGPSAALCPSAATSELRRHDSRSPRAAVFSRV